MTSNRDFRIENGRLLAYNGRDAIVHVPEGVVEIGDGAFTQLLTMAGANGSLLTMIPRGPQAHPIDAWIGRLALMLISLE